MPELIANKLSIPRLLSQVMLDESPAAIEWSACGRWLAAATTSGVVHLIRTDTGLQQTAWVAHEDGALTIRWHPTLPLLASSGKDGHVRLWLIASEQPSVLTADVKLTDDPANSWIEHLSWRPDGGQLAAACGKKICLLARDGSRENEYTFPGGTVGALCWRPKGSQLAAAGYGGIRIYNVLDPRSRPQDLHWKGSLLSLNWSPDAQVIAAGCQDNTVHFWRLPLIRDAMMSGFAYKPLQLSWSNNSRWLLTGGSSQLILWPFDKKGPEGRKPVSIDFHQEAICAISVTSSGQKIATGCRAGLVAIWNQIGDTSPSMVAHLDSRAEHLAWSPHKSTKLLATASRYGTLSLWEAAA
ncbi:MAG: WD40 repeat domain-containing protein [Moraxellaceae bacterium]|nr:WD40 repeat domain-containing protein [Moraxellaceae bacterium]